MAPDSVPIPKCVAGRLDQEAIRGWPVAALTMRVLLGGGLPLAGDLDCIGAELTLLSPVRPGDRLRVQSEILALEPPPRGSTWGVAAVRSTTRSSQ